MHITIACIWGLFSFNTFRNSLPLQWFTHFRIKWPGMLSLIPVPLLLKEELKLLYSNLKRQPYPSCSTNVCSWFSLPLQESSGCVGWKEGCGERAGGEERGSTACSSSTYLLKALGVIIPPSNHRKRLKLHFLGILSSLYFSTTISPGKLFSWVIVTDLGYYRWWGHGKGGQKCKSHLRNGWRNDTSGWEVSWQNGENHVSTASSLKTLLTLSNHLLQTI